MAAMVKLSRTLIEKTSWRMFSSQSNHDQAFTQTETVFKHPTYMPEKMSLTEDNDSLTHLSEIV